MCCVVISFRQKVYFRSCLVSLASFLAGRCEAEHLHAGCDESEGSKFKHAMWKTCSTTVRALCNTQKEGEENKAEALISISALLSPSRPASIKVRISENIESRWLRGEKQTSERVNGEWE